MVAAYRVLVLMHGHVLWCLEHTDSVDMCSSVAMLPVLRRCIVIEYNLSTGSAKV